MAPFWGFPPSILFPAITSSGNLEANKLQGILGTEVLKKIYGNGIALKTTAPKLCYISLATAETRGGKPTQMEAF